MNKGTVMNLERMHNMLSMICNASSSSQQSNANKNDMKFDMNYVELKEFLDRLVANDLIDCFNGQYSRFSQK